MTRIITLIGLCFILSSSSISKYQASPAKAVKMEGMRFYPRTIEIYVGDSIEWSNESNMWHNVVLEDGSFTSTMIKKGESIKYKFEKAGTYKYHCQPHRIMGMKGVVIVKEHP